MPDAVLECQYHWWPVGRSRVNLWIYWRLLCSDSWQVVVLTQLIQRF